MPRDAERWLAERGVTREPIRAEPPEADDVTPRQAVDLARQSALDARARRVDAPAASLDDDAARALAFIRRSTANTPQSEARMREKLAERGFAPAVVDEAVDRARKQRVLDDRALAAALVEERRAKGHAVARIRRDLARRGFSAELLDELLASAAAEDPEAAAFAVAQDKAAALGAVPAEKAFRRVVGHVVRRGYPDGLARKVAREAVFALRDDERVAGH